MKKVKVQKINSSIKDEGLAEMFNQMLGAGSLNLNIAYPRYKRIKSLCEQLCKLFRLLAASRFINAYPEFALQRAQIEAFCDKADTSINELFNIEFDYGMDLNTIDEETRKKFEKTYEEMKKSNLMNTIVILCDRLVKYKKNFLDLQKLNYKFITTMPGAEWCPFPFTNLNLKYIFSMDKVGANTMSFFMTILSKSYELSRQIYDEIQSPDIDVDQFVDVIISNIDKIKKVPELNRCDKAFKKIKESVGLLKNRFNGYYRDFIETKDSTIIMQHFILDVSKETTADPELTRQFKTIIMHYRKVAEMQISNPQIKMLFDKFNESFEQLERGTENLVDIRKEEPEPPVESNLKCTPDPKSEKDLEKYM